VAGSNLVISGQRKKRHRKEESFGTKPCRKTRNWIFPGAGQDKIRKRKRERTPVPKKLQGGLGRERAEKRGGYREEGFAP